MLGREAALELLGDEVRGELARPEPGMGHQRRQERHVVRHAADVELVQRAAHAIDRLVASLAVRAELGDHRVVEHRDLAALVDAGIDADVGSRLGFAVLHQAPRGRQEVAERVFSVETRLDGPALQLHVLLLERQLAARRHADHQLDQVEAGDQLGHRMLDLQARVHLEEVELAVLVDDELDGAGALVFDCLGQRDGLLAHSLARLGVEERARRLLDHLLVAALDRALALPEIDAVAVAVGDQLDLDVARLFDILLDEHAIVGERGLGLVGRRAEAFMRFGIVVGDAHALAAAAGRGLDHDRVADLLGDLHRLVGIGNRRQVTGHGADPGRLRELLRFDLVAHGVDGVGIGTDEGDAGLGQRLLEGFFLGQEAVARMHRLGAGRLAGLDDLVDQQVGLRRGRRSDQHRLVGLAHMQRVGVRFGVDRHGLDAETLAGPDDAAGDLAAIGDQDLVEQRSVGCRLRSRRLLRSRDAL